MSGAVIVLHLSTGSDRILGATPEIYSLLRVTLHLLRATVFHGQGARPVCTPPTQPGPGLARIAITAPDVLDAGASGQGLRHLGFARILAQEHRVDVLAPGNPGLPTGSAVLVRDPREQLSSLRKADFVITANAVLARHLPRVRGGLVFDLYDPSVIEALTIDAMAPGTQHERIKGQSWALRYALRHGSHLLCANNAQRDLYLGMILGLNLARTSVAVSGINLSERDLLERIIVAPNGVDDDPLPDRLHAREQLGIAPSDVVLLWGGGVWDWLDPRTILHAVKAAHEQSPGLRLIFLGLRRGGHIDSSARRSAELIQYCEQLGLLGSVVRINEEWVKASDRSVYLAASDAGVIGQDPHLESRFAFRTRLIDCLWGGLPVIAAGSDPLTEEGVTEGWAVRCPPGDVGAATDVIRRFAQDSAWRDELRAAAARGRDSRSWERTTEALRTAISNQAVVTRGDRVSRSVSALAAAALRRTLDATVARRSLR